MPYYYLTHFLSSLYSFTILYVYESQPNRVVIRSVILHLHYMPLKSIPTIVTHRGCMVRKGHRLVQPVKCSYLIVMSFDERPSERNYQSIALSELSIEIGPTRQRERSDPSPMEIRCTS